MKREILVFVLFCLTFILKAENQTYLIDNDATYDDFRARVKSNDIVLLPGDKLLFKRGEKFTGQLYVEKDSGENGNPIIINCYSVNTDETISIPDENIDIKDKPLVSDIAEDAEEQLGVLSFLSCDYVEIRNLHIENSTVNHNNNRKGISFIFYMCSQTIKNQYHVQIKNCKFNNIHNDAIYFAKPKTWFDGLSSYNHNIDDIVVEKNEINNTGWGIRLFDNYVGWETIPDDIEDTYKSKWFSNVIIRGNVIQNVRNNGIVVWGANGPVIENNYINNSGDKGYGQGIFCSYTNNALIQFNEVCNTKYDFYDVGQPGNPCIDIADTNPENDEWVCGDYDAGGIGIDCRTEGTICQYNYLHDNGLPGISILGYSILNKVTNVRTNNWVKDTIVRYNICANNSKTPNVFIEDTIDNNYFSGLEGYEEAKLKWQFNCGEIRFVGPIENINVYNNVFINSTNAQRMIGDQIFIDSDSYDSLLIDNDYFETIKLSNNIFYNSSENDIKYLDKIRYANYTNNNFFTANPLLSSVINPPNDNNSITTNPNFTYSDNISGLLENLPVNISSMNELFFLKLAYNSPCIGQGFEANIIDPYFKGDFWGNAAYLNLPDIGANESNFDPYKYQIFTNQYNNEHLNLNADGTISTSSDFDSTIKWGVDNYDDRRIKSYTNGKYLQDLGNGSVECNTLNPLYPSFLWNFIPRVDDVNDIWDYLKNYNTKYYLRLTPYKEFPSLEKMVYSFETDVPNDYSTTKWWIQDVTELNGNTVLKESIEVPPNEILVLGKDSKITLEYNKTIKLKTGSMLVLLDDSELLIKSLDDTDPNINETLLTGGFVIEPGAAIVISGSSNISGVVNLPSDCKYKLMENSVLSFGGGCNLTLNSTSMFVIGTNSKLIVKDGGSLIANGFTLTNQEKWKGIIAEAGSEVQLINSTISFAETAISGTPDLFLNIYGCSFTDCQNGINIVNCNSYTISYNTFTGLGTGTGISLTQSEGKLFYNSVKRFSHGVDLISCSPFLTRNTFSDNTNYGLYITGYNSIPQLVNPLTTKAVLNNVIYNNGICPIPWENAQILLKYPSNIYMTSGYNNVYSGAIGTVPTRPCVRGVSYLSASKAAMPYSIGIHAEYNYWGASIYTPIATNFNSFFSMWKVTPNLPYSGYSISYDSYATTPYKTDIPIRPTDYSTQSNPSTESTLLSNAIKLEDSGNYKASIKIYEKVIDKYDSTAEAYVALARLPLVYLATNISTEPLLTLYDTALESDNTSNKNFYKEMKVSTYLKNKKYDEAISISEEMRASAQTESEIILTEIDIAIAKMMKNSKSKEKGSVNYSDLVKNLISELMDEDNDSESSETTESNIPQKHSLYQNYPNPFNPDTTIKYALSKESNVNLKIYNSNGSQVADLVNGNQNTGYHNIIFDASKLSSGIYYYTLIVDSKYIATKKMLMLK